MYLPSAQVFERLHSAEGGLWLDETRDGEVIPVLKLETSALKAIHRGSKLRFIVSIVRYGSSRICCTGVECLHDPKYPDVLYGIRCGQHEEQKLKRFLSGECSRMFWFDELSRCVAVASCAMDINETRLAIAMLKRYSPLYRGENLKFRHRVLDRYQSHVRRPLDSNASFFVHDQRITLVSTIEKSFEIIGLTQDGAGRFRLDDETSGSEGSGLEQSIHQLLDSTFEDRLFRSPQIAAAGGGRELTDILCVSDEGIVLFESKVSPILITYSAASERRTKRVERNIEKGFRQLVGAIRQLRAGKPVFRQTGEPISYNQTDIIQAVVLVSDMLPGLDWARIAEKIKDLSRQHNAFFHVLDLTEIRKIVGAGERSDVFHLNLAKRWAAVLDGGTGLVIGRDPRQAPRKPQPILPPPGKKKASRK